MIGPEGADAKIDRDERRHRSREVRERGQSRKRGQPRRAVRRQRPHLAGLDVGQGQRGRRGPELSVAAEHRRRGRRTTGRRQVTHLQSGRGQQHLDRQVRRTVRPGRRVRDLARPLARVVDQLLQRRPSVLSRVLLVDDEQRWIGIEPRDADELIARVDRRAPEELVDLWCRRDAD